MKLSQNIKNSLWVIMANGLASLFQWLLISIMTKMFSLDIVGVYSSAVAIILPIITFFGLNLRAIQLTDIDNKYSLADYFVIRVLGSIFTTLIVFTIAIIKGNNTFALFITLIVLISRIIEIFSETAHSKFIKYGRYDRYGISMTVRSGISIVAFLIISLITKNFIMSFSLYTVIWIGVFLLYDCKYAEVKVAFDHYKFNWITMYELTIVCLPLAFVSSLNVLYNSIPKYFIEYYMSYEALGVFSATSYISLIGGLVVSGITLTFVTKLAQIGKEGDHKRFIRIILVQELLIIIASICLFVIFYFFGDIILPIMYTKEFVNYIDLILLLIVALSFNFTSSVLGTACTSVRKNKEQFYIAIICILSLSTSSYLLVPIYQLSGAAISMLITYLIKNILLIIVIIKIFVKKNVFKYAYFKTFRYIKKIIYFT